MVQRLTVRVEIVVAVGPRQLRGERGKRVVDGPGDDHVVVQADEAAGKDVGKAKTCIIMNEIILDGA